MVGLQLGHILGKIEGLGWVQLMGMTPGRHSTLGPLWARFMVWGGEVPQWAKMGQKSIFPKYLKNDGT